MPRNSYIYVNEMKGRNTAAAAKLLGVAKGTLLRWLRDGILAEPKRTSFGGMKWRIWDDADIARARKVKATQRRGPKVKK